MTKILKKQSLKKLNTFGVDALAESFVLIQSENDLTNLYESGELEKQPILILGGGSNMLFTQNFNGLILKITIQGIEVRKQEGEILVIAGAGIDWNSFVNFCVEENYGGVENLSLIPGTVGASPIQNIGAYGVELKDVFYQCRAFEIATGEFIEFKNSDCKFDYRDSIFKTEKKGKYIITQVTFKLNKSKNLFTSYGAISSELENRGIDKPSIKDISTVVSEIRVAKLPDPKTIGNAGSFFKNPIIDSQKHANLKDKFPEIVSYEVGGNYKLAAGWMIEQCGWKGKILGNTGTWKNQALVIVNHGGASGKEIFNFSTLIIDSVKEKFDVKLEREVNII